MFPSVVISDTFIHNSNPDSTPNPNPSYFQEHDDAPPLLFPNFPSPFFDDQSDFFSPQQHHHIFNNDAISISPKHDLGTDQGQASVSLAADPPPRKMRKDRHSKIYTAQGVRARRMRLPLQIARKFFDLQDMLGYDKASETIKWLMSKSKGAIREITKNIPSSSRREKGFDSSDSLVGRGKKKRELREKARSRARERTREKMRMRNIMTKLGCSASSKLDSSFDWSSSHQSLNKQFSNVGINADCSISRFHHHENILVGFDYNNSNSFMEFLENWDVENS